MASVSRPLVCVLLRVLHAGWLLRAIDVQSLNPDDVTGGVTPKWAELAEALVGDEVANPIFFGLLVQLAEAAFVVSRQSRQNWPRPFRAMRSPTSSFPSCWCSWLRPHLWCRAKGGEKKKKPEPA